MNSPIITGPAGDLLEAVPDGAASFALNLDIQEDGSLTTRRGFQDKELNQAAGTFRTDLLGIVEHGLVKYGLVAFRDATPTSNLRWVYSDGSGTITVANADASTIAARFVRSIVYNNKLWLVGTAGYQADISATFPPSALTFTSVAAMPAGDLAVVFRDRLFIVNQTTSRVYYSKATDFTIWAAPDGGFFDVSPNDGSLITSIAFDLNNLYIFKDNSTWVFSFSTDPGSDGFLRKIFDWGAYDAIYYEGTIYAVNSNGLFRIKGTTFELLSHVIAINPTPNTFLAVLENLLLVADNSSTGILTAVFNTRTGTWTYYDNGLFDSATGKHSLVVSNGIYSYTLFSYWRTVGANQSTGVRVATTRNDKQQGSSFRIPLDIITGSPQLYTKPKHILQTKRVTLAPDRLFKVLYPKAQWRYYFVTGAYPAASFKLIRSQLSTEAPTQLDPAVLSGMGATFQIPDTTEFGTNQPVGFTNGSNPDIANHRFKTLGTIGQLLIPAADIINTTTAFDLDIRNLFVVASFPGGEINDETANG